ncbi:hypothetical protein KGF86_06910 [Ornithinibacillus massiliensis]|uniref:Phage protein n=1 Tax=Ornithinibacillus massiliensis TaxID=1944633 RepID=A0ABS5MDF5_9BACI|nr:hypothetical protein [Ornithinibacillus massiliensis]MBS3679937.1 hypothetical protein [Ornithinibacillus massiliensis]
MKKITLMKIFAQECAILVDQGKSVNVQTVKEHIEKGDLINWLIDNYMGKSSLYMGVNSFSSEDISYVHEEYNALLMGYYDDEFSKWGIQNNGFNLLVSWGIEILRDVNENEKV